MGSVPERRSGQGPVSRRLRAAFRGFFWLLMLPIRIFGERPGQEETARERAQAAERVRNAMYLTQFGPFTGPASDRVLGKELRAGHRRPPTEAPR